MFTRDVESEIKNNLVARCCFIISTEAAPEDYCFCCWLQLHNHCPAAQVEAWQNHVCLCSQIEFLTKSLSFCFTNKDLAVGFWGENLLAQTSWPSSLAVNQARDCLFHNPKPKRTTTLKVPPYYFLCIWLFSRFLKLSMSTSCQLAVGSTSWPKVLFN